MAPDRQEPDKPGGGPYRLLFLDLDGTLVSYADHEVSPRTLDALHRAQAAGCTVVICTGRSRYLARHVADCVGGHSYGICLNGAVVLDWRTDQLLHRIALPLETAREATRITHAHGLAPLCFGVDEDDRWVYTDRRFAVHPEYAGVSAERLVYHDDLCLDMTRAPITVETYGTAEQMETLVESWKVAFGDRVVAFTWEATRFGCRGAHLHPVEVNKAHGARVVAERLGIPRAQTLAIGDEVNDLELLRWAGLGIAMADANAQVRAAADHVTASQAEDGVALAIERFVLQ